MKNLFRFLMAVAILFTASCAKEDISSSIAGEETIEVFFATNLADLGTRAYDDGTNVTTLRYFVCDNAGNILNNLSDTIVEDDKDGKFSFSLNLIKSMEYNIYFWAHSGAYTISENGVVSIDYTNNAVAANNGDLDAFYAAVNIPAGQAGTTQNVSLTRPFAQLNVLTSDGAEILKNDVASYANITSSATVEGVYSQFDLRNGAVTGNPQTVTFAADVIPTGKGEATLKADYTYLSMNYLFVPTSCVADVQFTFTATRTNNAIIEVETPEYTSVPLKPNYRTNILGALLTNPTAFNVEVVKDYDGKEDYEIEKVHVASPQALKDAVATAATTGGEIVLTKDIELSEILAIAAPTTQTASRTATEPTVIVIDGKGRTLTSSATRAINISGNVNVTIKNLTINASGERAINLIQNAKHVTLDNVTATAANYTVNIAASAPYAVVDINNSTLDGLCTVNVSAVGAQVTLDRCTVNCNDNNPTEGESYAALSLNMEAVGGSIIATNTTVNVTEGSDSMKGRNAAENGTVTINGSTDEVSVMVAAVLYGDSPYYHTCATLQQAINTAIEKNAASVRLIKDVELEEPATVAEGATVVLDLNGKTLSAKDEANAYVLNNHGTLTIKGNGVVNARGIYNGYGNGGDNVATAKLIVENGTFNAKGSNGGACVFNYGIVEVKGGKFESNGGYGLNNQPTGVLSVANAVVNGGIYNQGNVTIENSTVYQHLSGKHAIYNWQGNVTINSGNFDSLSRNELILADGTNASVVINGGEYKKTAKSWLFGAATGKNISFVINGGMFYGYVNLPENTVDTIRPYGDPIVVTGGQFNFNPTNWLAEGYVATEKNGVWTVVGTITSEAGLEAALAEGGEVILGANIELTKTAVVTGVEATINLNGYTLTAASSNAIQANEGAKVTIKNGKIVAYEAIVRAVGGEVVIENGEYTQTGTAVDTPSTYRYAIDSRENGKITINGGVFKSNNGMINVSSEVVINGGKFENIVEKSMTRHFAYVSAPLTINDGEFYGKANGSAGGCFFCGAASGCAITINGGKFTSLWTSGSVNRIFEVYYGGSINVTGGLFNSNGGITSFVTANTDDATKVAYPYVAK